MIRATLLVTGLVFALAGRAHAGIRCSDLDLPSPIYVAGSESSGRLLRALATLLLAEPDQATIVYQPRPGCAAVEAIVRDTDPTSCQQGACIFGAAIFYTHDGVAKTCELNPAGTHLHAALSDVFARSCPGLGGGMPKDVVDLLGPVSPYAFVVPRRSAETAIHAEEAHFVLGMGKDGQVLPWNYEDAILVRDERSAGQVLLGHHIRVAPGRFRGLGQRSYQDILQKLASLDPAQGLAFLPTAIADLHRADVRVLAFQAIGQRGAFFPDKHRGSFDKQNVRDGHYPLWGYLHLIARADAGQPEQPRSAAAQRLADLLLGRKAPAKVDPLLLQLEAGLVPLCAMQVGRLADGAPLMPYTPPAPCGCWYEKNVAMGATACTECKDDGACSGGRCRRGFCEVQ